MPSIDPDREALQQAAKLGAGRGPICMLNLLRFAQQANYPDDSGHAPCSGREAYGRYAQHAVKAIDTAGATIEWSGEALSSVIAPEDEQWDEVFIVRYPSIEAFLGMVMDPAYQAQTVHRSAALQDARLIMIQPKPHAAPEAR